MSALWAIGAIAVAIASAVGFACLLIIKDRVAALRQSRKDEERRDADRQCAFIEMISPSHTNGDTL